MEPASLFRELEKTSVEKDIKELNDMISDYYRRGSLSDREKAYRKILELRIKEPDLNAAAKVMQAVHGTVPFEQATDEAIVEEMRTQVLYLTKKLFSTQTEDNQTSTDQEAPHANP